MAIIDLAALTPTKISRDISDKYILIYGLPKVGKTSFAAQCPQNLIFCFEQGVNFQSNIYAVPVTSWSDFKAFLRQLSKQENKDKYKTVTIDTVSWAWDLCTRYICSQNNVKTLADIPWGKGYQLAKDEFANALRDITLLGYGVILITHADKKTITSTGSEGEEISIERIEPALPERAQKIINAMVDIIGYINPIYDEAGEVKSRQLITRGTQNVVAGSRLRFLPKIIPFGYQDLIDNIAKAIDLEEQNGAIVCDKSEIIITRPFEEVVEEAKEHWARLAVTPEKVEEIMVEVEKLFGERKKLSEITVEEQALFEELIDIMKAMD